MATWKQCDDSSSRIGSGSCDDSGAHDSGGGVHCCDV